MATSVSAQHVLQRHLHSVMGKYANRFTESKNTLGLMQLHSRWTSIRLMLLPGELYATKRFYTTF